MHHRKTTKITQNNQYGDNTYNNVSCGAKPRRGSSCTASFWVSGVSLFISLVCFGYTFVAAEIVVSDTSIVLGFVGVLSTFVVIGNYLQAKAAEDKADRNERLLNDTQAELRKIQTDIYRLKLENAKIKARIFSINPRGFFKEKNK